MNHPPSLSDVVVVGASLAGVRAAEVLRDEGYEGRLTLIGDEPGSPYDRPPLSKEFLRGEFGPDDVLLPAAAAVEATWCAGVSARAIDAADGVVYTSDGDSVRYDGLILATGSSVRCLPTFDETSPSVHTLRRLSDALRLRAALVARPRLLIVGCGFVGIEVASSAVSLNATVTVVSLDPPLAAAGVPASAEATRLLSEAGVRLCIGLKVSSASVVAGVHQITLSDGSVLEADHVVVAVGAVPNVEWLAGSGATLDDGVVCDEFLRVVGLPGAVAAGDIVRWPNPTFGGMHMRVEHWNNAIDQGAAAARSLLAADAAEPFASVPTFWSDHFGVRLTSVGLPSLADRFETIAGSPGDGPFAAAAYRRQTLVGGTAYGMPRALVGVRAKLAKIGVSVE